MKIKFKRLTETAKMPTRGSISAAGYDLYADEFASIGPGQCCKISTGIATEIPEGYFGAIYPRSGLATKQGLRLSNCVGIVDSDYRGCWFVPLYNDNFAIKEVHPGDRIAQVVFQPYLSAEFEEVNELDSTDRNVGGFGSTGIK